MKHKSASVAKVVALAAVPLSLAVLVATVAHQRRAEAATEALLSSVDFDPYDLVLDTPALKDLITQGANINVHTRKGSTPLHYAASFNASGVQVLIDNGADVNAREDSGRTPLMNAVQEQQVETVRLLLSKGANPNLRTTDIGGQPFTPLTSAILILQSNPVSSGVRAREIIQLLKAAGAKE